MIKKKGRLPDAGFCQPVDERHPQTANTVLHASPEID
jgi:hypothetical protein